MLNGIVKIKKMKRPTANEKKLIQLRTKLEFYKKLDKKLDKILNAEIEIEDYGNEIYGKIQRLETELTDLKWEMLLPDDRWDEDESA